MTPASPSITIPVGIVTRFDADGYPDPFSLALRLYKPVLEIAKVVWKMF
jgi:hypothetical protein